MTPLDLWRKEVVANLLGNVIKMLTRSQDTCKQLLEWY
jgi:hypothetical protein